MYVICAGKDSSIIGIYDNLELAISDWKKIKVKFQFIVTNPHYFYVKSFKLNSYVEDILF